MLAGLGRVVVDQIIGDQPGGYVGAA